MFLIKYFFIFISLLGFLDEPHAAILKHDISSIQNHDFTFREMCETMGSKNLEMISANSLSEIDCMGKTFKSIDFCLKKLPLDKGLTRGIVDEKNKKIICETSTSVMLSISCDERDIKYCRDPKKGCEELKKIFAHSLELVHSSILEKKINCYFSKHTEESLNEL